MTDHHAHDHDGETILDAEFWNERYRSSQRVWSGEPNPQLVAEVADLPPGRALDVGCGEGGDAIWLAGRGWEVVATDHSSVALERGEQHALDTDADAARRIEWRQADLLAQPPEPDSFDLVSAQFMHLPREARSQLFPSLAASVRSGGTLLVVGHDQSDLDTGLRRPPVPGLLHTTDEVVQLLDESWTVLVSEARPRQTTGPDGNEATAHDTVVRAIRH